MAQQHTSPTTSKTPNTETETTQWYLWRVSLATLGFSLVGALAAWMTTFHGDVRRVFPFVPVGLPLADIVDLFPLVLSVPCLYLMFRIRPDRTLSDLDAILFVTAVAFWTLGTGLHNAANALDHIVRHLDPDIFCPSVESSTAFQSHSRRPWQTYPCVVRDVHAVTYWYDEVLSHAVQHTSLHLLALLCIRRQITFPFPVVLLSRISMLPSIVTAVAGVLYGVETFMFTVEGQTVHIGLPYVIAVITIALFYYYCRYDHTTHPDQQYVTPVLRFYTISACITLVLLAAWYAWHGGFPEFSELGLLA